MLCCAVTSVYVSVCTASPPWPSPSDLSHDAGWLVGWLGFCKLPRQYTYGNGSTSFREVLSIYIQSESCQHISSTMGIFSHQHHQKSHQHSRQHLHVKYTTNPTKYMNTVVNSNTTDRPLEHWGWHTNIPHLVTHTQGHEAIVTPYNIMVVAKRGNPL